MIIKDCTFETICMDLQTARKGILIHLTNQEGFSTTTEASPLPFYSKETFEEALSQLENCKNKLLTTWWTKERIRDLAHLSLYPSVYFAIEMALNDLLFPLEKTPQCETYALLMGSPEKIFSHAEKVASEGFFDVKVKLGSFSLPIAHQIVDRLSKNFRLRIDLNRKWDVKKTLQFCSHYPYDFFTYIEEPTTKKKDLLQFPYPFALDETLRENFDDVFSEHLKALILKPTLTYPIEPYLHLGPEIILTSSFESPIGIGQIQRLIHRNHLTKTKHGLDTLRYDSLSHSLLEKALP